MEESILKKMGAIICLVLVCNYSIQGMGLKEQTSSIGKFQQKSSGYDNKTFGEG